MFWVQSTTRDYIRPSILCEGEEMKKKKKKKKSLDIALAYLCVCVCFLCVCVHTWTGMYAWTSMEVHTHAHTHTRYTHTHTHTHTHTLNYIKSNYTNHSNWSSRPNVPTHCNPFKLLYDTNLWAVGSLDHLDMSTQLLVATYCTEHLAQ